MPRLIAKFYLHDALSTVPGTLPTGTHSLSTPDLTVTGAGTARSMDAFPGTGQVAVAYSDLAAIGGRNNYVRTFVSQPLAAQTIAIQTLTLRGGIQQSNTDSNLEWFLEAYTWRPSTGALVTRLIDSSNSGAIAANTNEQDFSWAAASTSSVTVVAGDVLVCEMWQRPVHTAATSYTDTAYYDGATDGSATDNAAYFQLTTAVLMQEEGYAYQPVRLASGRVGPPALRRLFHPPQVPSGTPPPPAATFDPSTGFPWTHDDGELFVLPWGLSDATQATFEVPFDWIQCDFLQGGVFQGCAGTELLASQIAALWNNLDPQLSVERRNDDESIQAWAVGPPQNAVRLGAFAVDGGEVQAQPGQDDTGQAWFVTPPQNAVRAQVFNTPDEASFSPTQDDTGQTYPIQPPVVTTVSQLTAFVGDPDVVTLPTSDDPSVQAWAVGPPQNADRLTAWNGDSDVSQQTPTPDDSVQSWAVGGVFDPASGFPWTGDSDVPLAQPISDDTGQSWAVAPLTFNPAAGFPWPVSDDIVQPTWFVADDTTQAWTPQPVPFVQNSPTDHVLPAWLIDHDGSNPWTATLAAVTVVTGGHGPDSSSAYGMKPAGSATSSKPSGSAMSSKPAGSVTNPRPAR